MVMARPGFISAYDPKLLQRWQALDVPPVIAVGRTAEDRVRTELGVEPTFLESPSHEIAKYDQMILEALDKAGRRG
jgi:hypothetical protein